MEGGREGIEGLDGVQGVGGLRAKPVPSAPPTRSVLLCRSVPSTQRNIALSGIEDIEDSKNTDPCSPFVFQVEHVWRN